MPRLAPLALLAVLAVAGCANSTPGNTATTWSPTPAASVSARPSSAAATPTTSASATPSAAPSTTAGVKQLSTAKLPTKLGDYTTPTVTAAAGGQTATYSNPNDASDLFIGTIAPVGEAQTVAGRFTSPKTTGLITCGTYEVGGVQAAACVVPLSTGYVLLNGSGKQTADQMLTLTQTLYSSLA